MRFLGIGRREKVPPWRTGLPLPKELQGELTPREELEHRVAVDLRAKGVDPTTKQGQRRLGEVVNLAQGSWERI